MVTKWSEQFRDVMDEARRRFNLGDSLLAGVMAGGIGLLLSFIMKGLIPARPLGDPLPLILAVTSVPRGFTYFQWRPPLLHLLFAVFLGFVALLVLRAILRRPPTRHEATRAGRIAALLGVVVVALLAVDALIVGIWYLIAGAVSILVTGFTAGFLASRWPR